MTTKNTLFASATLAFVLAAASAAHAQVDPMIDADGDGAYSYAELQVAHPDLTQEEFDAMDTSGDGVLDADEVAAAVAAGTFPAAEG